MNLPFKPLFHGVRRVRLICVTLLGMAGLALAVSAAEPDPAEQFLWAHRLGASPQSSLPPDVAVADSGEVLVGWTANQPLVGPPAVGYAKLTADGNFAWRRHSESVQAGTAWMQAIAPNEIGGAYLAGTFTKLFRLGTNEISERLAGFPDGFLASVDAAGDTVWLRRLDRYIGGGPGGLATDESGNTYVAGQAYEEYQENQGIPFPWGERRRINQLAKVNREGTREWCREFPARFDRPPLVVATGVLGAVWLSGELKGTVEFGSQTLDSQHDHDRFLARLDAAGNAVWARRTDDLLGIQWTTITALQAGPDGTLFVTGTTGGGDAQPLEEADGILARLTDQGTLIWLHRSGDSGSMGPRALALDRTGRLRVAGLFSGTVSLDGFSLTSGPLRADGFVAGINPAGGVDWIRQVGGSEWDSIDSIDTDGTGATYLAGRFSESIDFDGTRLDAANPTYKATFVAKLGVRATAVPRPSFLSHPVGQRVTEAEPVNFSVTVKAGSAVTYQWRFNGADLPAGTNASHALSSAGFNDAGNYSVLVSCAGGSQTSSNAVLTVLPRSPGFQLPAIASGMVGTPLSHEIGVIGTVDRISAQGLPPGLSFEEETRRIFGVPAQAGMFPVSLLALNSGGSAQVVFNLVIAPASARPTIVTQPQDTTVPAGGTATLLVTVVSALPFSVQWQFQGADIPGASGTSLSLSNAAAAHAGSYRAVVTNAAGPTTSSPATVAVRPAPVPPVITSPSAGAGTLNFPFSFPIIVIGETTGYAAAGLPPGLSVDPRTGLIHGIPSVSGVFVATVSAHGSEASATSPLTLTITEVVAPPVINRQPVAQTVPSGGTASFFVHAERATAYQWFFNDTVQLPDATGPVLQLSNVTSRLAGRYRVRLSSPAGGVYSSNAVLRVLTPPRINALRRSPNGPWRLEVLRGDGTAHDPAIDPEIEVWVTTNLASTNWTRLSNQLVFSNGAWELDEDSSNGSTPRFYRVIER